MYPYVSMCVCDKMLRRSLCIMSLNSLPHELFKSIGYYEEFIEIVSADIIRIYLLELKYFY